MQLKIILLLAIIFAILAGVKDILSLMLLGTWGTELIVFWWSFIVSFISISFLSIKFKGLKILSGLLAIPLLSAIFARAIYCVFVGLYFPINSYLVSSFMLGAYFSALLVLYLYSLGLYQELVKPFVLVLCIALLPLSHQFAYDGHKKSEVEKSSNKFSLHRPGKSPGAGLAIARRS